MTRPSTELRRELGIPGAVITGLGSILGTGVFVSIGIGAGVAGNSVVWAIVVAALVAICNGLSSAQLAASHPVSGGTYEYGYHWLTPRLGFLAGWMFLWAKSASAATAALGFAGYLLPWLGVASDKLLVPVAMVAVVLLTAVVLGGIKRSSQINAIIVGITLFALCGFVVVGLLAKPYAVFDAQGIVPQEFSWVGFAQATGMMFVAYTGYGRIATLGEEVKEPRRTIPIAVIVTLAVSMTIYFLVALVGVQTVGAGQFAEFTQSGAAPLESIARKFEVPGIPTLMTIGAITAMLGVLLNLLLGLSRVALAMGRRHDFPPIFARIQASSGVPGPATILVGLIIGTIVLLGSVKLAWSFSAFTVLVYYTITNACALAMKPEERLYPRFVPVLGFVACLSLSFWVQREVWLVGIGVLIAGLVWHQVAQVIARRQADDA
ncbi:APC family permease [Bremerella cremea]|uniref:APC family permease n=1 Tax=Bremerella cremea TaxID=1031537 RepID=UPI0031EE0E5A